MNNLDLITKLKTISPDSGFYFYDNPDRDALYIGMGARGFGIPAPHNNNQLIETIIIHLKSLKESDGKLYDSVIEKLEVIKNETH